MCVYFLLMRANTLEIVDRLAYSGPTICFTCIVLAVIMFIQRLLCEATVDKTQQWLDSVQHTA